MLMKELVVIMSLYKNDKLEYLQKTVNSILSQSFSEFDFLIQFDGEVNEDCANYLSSLNDDRIKIFKRSENKGLAQSLNELLEYALKQGYKYIARMDADDICSEDRLQKQVDYLKKNQNVDLVGTCANIIDEKGKLIGQKMVAQEITFDSLIKSCDLIHPSVMFKSEFFKLYGDYNTYFKKSQDYELWLRASKDGAVIHNIQEVLFNLRYESQIIHRRKVEQKYNIQIKKKYLSGFKLLIAIIPNVLVMILPQFIISTIIRFKIK